MVLVDWLRMMVRVAHGAPVVTERYHQKTSFLGYSLLRWKQVAPVRVQFADCFLPWALPLRSHPEISESRLRDLIGRILVEPQKEVNDKEKETG